MQEMSTEQIDSIFKRHFNGLIYTYTPMCGTCQVSGRMLTVIEELLPEIEIRKLNVNFFPELAAQLTIESVPCLLFIKEGVVAEKLYAFRSVPYLYEKIKQFI